MPGRWWWVGRGVQWLVVIGIVLVRRSSPQVHMWVVQFNPGADRYPAALMQVTRAQCLTRYCTVTVRQPHGLSPLDFKMIRRAWQQCLVGGGGWAEVCSGLWQHSSEVRHWALVTYVIAAGYLSAPGLNCTTQIRTWGLFLTSTIPMALPGCSGHARKASFSWANWCTLHIWRWPSFAVSWKGVWRGLLLENKNTTVCFFFDPL